MKKSKDLQFIRYGGLSSVKQKGYDPAMPGFHSPPARRGVYCFVFPYVEKFLLSGSFGKIGKKNPKFEYKKDKDGNPIKVDPETTNDWMHCKNNTEEWFAIKLKKGKVFSYEGEIWHHLKSQLKPTQIIEEKGRWVKSSYEDFKYAFFKEMYKITQEKAKTGLNSPRDHLEVFIEKI